jgi:hypothetical protein
MSGSASGRRSGAIGTAPVLVAIGASFAFFAFRLWQFVAHNAVDVPYWDLWDVLDPLFRGHGTLAAMWIQHGPVRQGLGGLLYAVSNGVTGWDFRAVAFENAAILAIAALFALELKFRVAGRWSIADALIPAIVLRLNQYSTLVVIPYPAHGIVPLLLVILGCRALLLRNGVARLVAVGAVSAAAANTGFAIFLPFVIAGAAIAVAAVEWRAERREQSRSSVALGVVAGVCALPALAGYHFGSMGAIPCPDVTPLFDHASYVVTMINGSFGIFRRDAAAIVLGALAFALPAATVVAIGAKRALVTAKAGPAAPFEWQRLVPALLVTFSLVFAASSSIGRLCADGAALNSRYVTLMIPLALGIQLALSEWRPDGRASRLAQNVVMALFALVVLAGAFRLSAFDAQVVEESVTGKRRWVDCVKAGGSADECNRRAQFAIYPGPVGEGIDAKIEFLRRRGLSFFAEREPVTSK